MISLHWRIASLFFVLLVSGCVSTPPINSTNTPNMLSPSASGTSIVETSANLVPSAGDPLTLCIEDDESANEECFEDVFAVCGRAVGTFWKTKDNDSLSFESQGVEADSGKCNVRVTVLGDSTSPLAGQSANCLIAQTPSAEDESKMAYDLYQIGPSNCSGSLVDSIQKTPPSSEPQSENVPPVETAPPIPQPAEKSFSFSVDDVSGPIGENEFHVNTGDHVTLYIATSTSNVSFGGAWTRAPAGPKLADETAYIFTTGTVPPGQTKVVEFTAGESFEFGVYWPGSNALKGKGKIIVDAP